MYNQYLDTKKFEEFNRFLIKVNERTDYQYGLKDTYSNDNNPVLDIDVEYFGFNILQDMRIRYIIENIVACNELSPENKICNTFISHFYGAKDIHSTITGISDVKKAHVDFERIAKGDRDYLDSIKRSINISKKQKKKFYGTTELHTSLQTAARNFCREKYQDPHRQASLTDILEWLSGWLIDGTVNKFLNDCNTLEKFYHVLTDKKGIGEYYGYHASTSNSVNTVFQFDHNEEFCKPGPGAKRALDTIFPKLKSKGKMPYDKLIWWIRENQDVIVKDLKIHDFFHNIEINDNVKVFKESQDKLKIYGIEVGLCQFDVKNWLQENPHLINRRKIVYEEKTATLDKFLI